jgi:hypothetical protein
MEADEVEGIGEGDEDEKEEKDEDEAHGKSSFDDIKMNDTISEELVGH